MTNLSEAQGHVGYPAKRADIRHLVLWRQDDGRSVLTHAAPTVLQNVALEKDTLGVLYLEQILYYEGPAGSSAHKSRLSGLPDQRLEKMVMPDFDIRRRGGCGCASENNVLARSLQEVIYDFEGSHGMVAGAASDGLRVGTGAGNGDTMEI